MRIFVKKEADKAPLWKASYTFKTIGFFRHQQKSKGAEAKWILCRHCFGDFFYLCFCLECLQCPNILFKMIFMSMFSTVTASFSLPERSTSSVIVFPNTPGGCFQLNCYRLNVNMPSNRHLYDNDIGWNIRPMVGWHESTSAPSYYDSLFHLNQIFQKYWLIEGFLKAADISLKIPKAHNRSIPSLSK